MIRIKTKVREVRHDEGLSHLFTNGSARARVGVLHDTPHAGSDLSVAQLAAVHEYGSPTRNIKRRSFLASTLDRNARAYTAALEALSKKAVLVAEKARGAKDAALTALKAAMQALADRVRDDVVRTINSGVPPQLDEAYARRKGKSRSATLVDTGQMRDAIETEVVVGKKAVGSS